MSRAFDGWISRLRTPLCLLHHYASSYDTSHVSEMLAWWVERRSGCTHLPRWIYSGSFDDAKYAWNRMDMCARRALLACVAHRPASSRYRDVDSDDEEEVSYSNKQPVEQLVALFRLRFGEMVEDDMSKMWSMSNENKLWCTQVALAAAVWTSSHAEYLYALDRRVATEPTIHLVPSELTEYNLGEFTTSAIPFSEGNRVSHAMCHLLFRSLNTANRGWTSSSAQIIKHPNAHGLRHILTRAILVTMTGMHTCIDPPDRPSWRERIRLHHELLYAFSMPGVCLLNQITEKAHCMLKEVLRRMLLSAFSSNPVAREIHNKRKNIEDALTCPPFTLAPARHRIAMATIAKHAIAVSHDYFVQSIDSTLSRSVDKHTSRLQTETKDWPWNGRSCAAPSPIMLKEAMYELFNCAHRNNFDTLWRVSHQMNVRLVRLDPVQYDVLCEESSSIVAAKGKGHVFRHARNMPYSERLSLQQGLEMVGVTCSVTQKNYEGLLKELSDEKVGTLLAFSRMAAYLDQVRVVQWSEDIEAKQRAAVLSRYGATCWNDIPVHATHLCVCSECHRVANAYPPRGAAHIPFVEMGLSSCVAMDPSGSMLRCAKRGSAALRIAQQSELFACTHAVDMSPQVKLEEAVANCDMCLNKTFASNLRRDAKRTFEQSRNVHACGEHELVTLPLAGRIVRIYDAWYTLCCFCGAIVARACAQTNVDGLPSCMRCGELKINKKSARKTEKAPEYQCRFCNQRRADLVPFHSPHDTAPENDALPPPLRTTFWCARHRRDWVKDALQEMDTPSVLHHIANNTCPTDREEDRPAKHTKKGR